VSGPGDCGSTPAHITTRFPEGKSYQQVVWRVAAWLNEVSRDYAQRTVLMVGHRATFYALKHLINGVPLQDAVLKSMAVAAGMGVPAGLTF
jgi:2,3-bisphosphoglycerate-dependent phosphoglycerate mutase